jgi:lysophospholipase L1-like esterase
LKNILCFGDSNTHGYIPGGAGRYTFYVRWTGKLQAILGNSYHIIEEGLNGRTTVFEDPIPGRRAIDYIAPCVRTHAPLDMIIFMLGSNDCKFEFNADEHDIAAGMRQVLETARSACTDCKPMILLISPPHLSWKKWSSEFDAYSEETCLKLACEYKKIANDTGSLFIDASKFVKPSEKDLLHLDEKGHVKLARTISKVIINELS